MTSSIFPIPTYGLLQSSLFSYFCILIAVTGMQQFRARHQFRQSSGNIYLSRNDLPPHEQ
jgi:hypothetical protein